MNDQFEILICSYWWINREFQEPLSENKRRRVGKTVPALYLWKHLSNLLIQIPSSLTTNITTQIYSSISQNWSISFKEKCQLHRTLEGERKESSLFQWLNWVKAVFFGCQNKISSKIYKKKKINLLVTVFSGWNCFFIRSKSSIAYHSQ